MPMYGRFSDLSVLQWVLRTLALSVEDQAPKAPQKYYTLTSGYGEAVKCRVV